MERRQRREQPKWPLEKTAERMERGEHPGRFWRREMRRVLKFLPFSPAPGDNLYWGSLESKGLAESIADVAVV